jgi:hypothetical protein
MSLDDVIISFSNNQLWKPFYYRRYAAALPYVNGIAPTPVLQYRRPFTAVIEVATGMQRVVPGFDMHSVEDGQYTVDVRLLYTTSDLRPRRPTNEPDIVEYDGSDWEVFRVEDWQLLVTGFKRVVITRLTQGAS